MPNARRLKTRRQERDDERRTLRVTEPFGAFLLFRHRDSANGVMGKGESEREKGNEEVHNGQP